MKREDPFRPTFHFAVPGDISSPTGGYGYARALLANAAGVGMSLELIELPGSFPYPSPQDIAETGRLLGAVPASATILVDGLAFGAMPEELVASLPQQLVALVHHPLAFETGLAPDAADRLRENERRALVHADAVIVTSDATVHLLCRDYGVPQHRITLAEPGVAPRARATPDQTGPVRLLSVGAVSPRKGYDVLIEAMSMIGAPAWSLSIVGATNRDPQTAQELARRIVRSGLSDRITMHGALSDAALDAHFRRTHLFVLSSRFEGYGMVLTEAVAYGLPVIATDGTPALEALPAEAALGVPADHPRPLARAIEAVVSAPERLAAMSDAAWRHAGRLPRWRDTAVTVARVLREVR